jgi:uncharacterized protein (DUF1501 family)
MAKRRKINRRQFIGEASCAAVGSTTLFSMLSQLFMTNALSTSGMGMGMNDDYKALVCILLAGGNDSFNMLIPRSDDEYNEYVATRSNLSIPQDQILPINPITSDGREYGVHPSMGGVQNLFEDGKLAFISNVGTLYEPIMNRDEYHSREKTRPLGLYSHSDQIQQWQTSVPQSREAAGWGGRLADIMQSLNDYQGISMNISLSGRNVFQSGDTVLEYAIQNEGTGVEGVERIKYQNNQGFLNMIRDQAVDSLTSDVYSHVFKQTFSEQMRSSIEAQNIFSNAIANVPPMSTTFSDHYLSENLEMVAKVIAARQDLGMTRQTFFMTFGGWDHHNELINNQNYMLGVVNNALSEFNAALEEIGMEDKVTTFTISDFSRTLTTNGNGSDHAWGGNQIVMGGSVIGKEIYGNYPALYLDGNPLNVSNRGILIPTTSCDAFFAELALWFGLSSNDLTTVLPNIGNFYSPGDPDWPIGFLTQS